MTFEQITTPAHVALVKSVFYRIFPEEAGRNNCGIYEDSINGNLNGCSRLEYYMVFDGGALVGTTGIYSVNDDEAWLGWYGVLPERRNAGYGGAILDFTLNKMRSYRYKTALLYTEKDVNVDACRLYRSRGFVEGKTYSLFNGEAVDAKIIGNYQDRTMACMETVFFRSLDGHTMTEWNGTPVF